MLTTTVGLAAACLLGGVALGQVPVPDRPKAPGSGSGSVATSDGATVVCQVAGRSAILSVTPAGRLVKAGQVICVLDPTEARGRVAQQDLAARRTEAVYRQAVLTREAAELARLEHEAKRNLDVEVASQAAMIAEAELTLARSALAAIDPKSPAGPELRKLAEQKVRRAEEALAKALGDRKRLEMETIPKEKARLAEEIDRARSVESAAARTDAEADRELERVRKELEGCRIVAPIAGQLLHVRWRSPRGNEGYVVLEPGATVQERQVLFRIVPAPPIADAPR